MKRPLRGKHTRQPTRRRGGEQRRLLTAQARVAQIRVQENPQAKALAHQVALQLLDKKAVDVLILDVRGKTSYADYFVIASGDSTRQVTAMADHLEENLRKVGTHALGTEGYASGIWVLLDLGEVVVHLFFNEAREFYDLEGLWADVPREKVA